jgi:hypothetical protein
MASFLAVSTPSFAQSTPFCFHSKKPPINIDWLGEGLPELILDRLSGRSLYVFDRAEESQRMKTASPVGVDQSLDRD